MGIAALAPSDEQLAARAADGDRSAFETLVRRHAGALLAYCRRLMQDDAEAEDRVQEAFLKAYAHIDRYSPGRRFGPWLFTIAHHTCIDALRTRKAWAPLGEADPPAAEDRRPLVRDDLEALEPALAALDPRARAVLHCKYTLGLSAPEIAARLEMTPGNVRVVLHRAIKTLRGRLT